MKSVALLLSILSFTAFGIDSKPYEWQKDRQRYNLSEPEKAFTEYLLKYHRQYDFEWEDTELIMYVTEHRITRVTNPETVQRHNKIYISLNNVLDVMELKARAINKDGKVTFFDQSNLKEIKDTQTGGSYKIFAVEGIESDSEVEFYYTLKMKRKVFETVYLQFEMPIMEASLKVSCPVKLDFDFRTYHDSVKVLTDTLHSKNNYTVTIKHVPGLAKENYSYFNANRKRVELKLAHNYTSGSARLNTWPDAAKTFYRSIAKLDPESESAMEKYFKILEDDKTAPLGDRIRNIEDEVKNSILVADASSGESGYDLIPDILKHKLATARGMTRILVWIYTRLGIENNIVLTCSRETAKFDKSFDTWAYLDDYLIYFPSTKEFIAPGDGKLRYPLIPTEYGTNNGLFIEPVTVGSVKSAIGSVHEIPALPYTANSDNLLISVQFDKSLEFSTIIHKRIFRGYYASSLSFYYSRMTEEEKVKFLEELFRSSIPDIKLTKWSASATVENNIPRFDVEVTYTTDHFLEKAGPKTLFKAGELIGPQSELYRDDHRMTDIENPNNRAYERVITITIPDGYKMVNTDALKMKTEYKDGEKIPFSFFSDYSIEKGVLKIIVNEYYKEILVPLKRYEDFRKVINAAADFNKATLVLEPK